MIEIICILKPPTLYIQEEKKDTVPLVLGIVHVTPSIINRSRDGAVVRTLASRHCGPCSIPHSVSCALSFLLVLLLAPRGFSLGIPVFLSPQKPTFPNSNSIWIIVKHFIMSLSFGRLCKHSHLIDINKLLYSTFTLLKKCRTHLVIFYNQHQFQIFWHNTPQHSIEIHPN